MKNLNDIFNINSAGCIQSGQAIEGLMDSNSAFTYAHLIELLFDELSEMPIYDGEAQELYRFTKLTNLNKDTSNIQKPVINDIKTNSLTLANPKYFNDPMDPILREWIKLKEKKDHIDKKLFNDLDKSLDNLRICCLSKQVNINENVYINPLMWAHYADSHKGICIKYEITKESIAAHNDKKHVLRINDVRYRRRKAMSDYITLDNALLAKGECWDYEHEQRLIYFSKDSIRTTRKKGAYISLKGFSIKAIYLGYRISIKDMADVIEAVGGKNIDIFQVKFDSVDITKLIAVKKNSKTLLRNI